MAQPVEKIQRENKMGVQHVPTLLIKMSLPMMASMLVMALYNIVDSIFVSRISENALTAVSLVYPFQMLFTSVAVGTGVGVNSLIARRLGEQRQAEADSAAATGQFLALVSAVAFMLIYAIFPRQLLSSFADNEEILNYATTYLQLCGGLCGFAVIATMAEKTIQATGDTIRPMMIQLAGAIFNIIFDPILIFGYFGFPAMGVAGAAIATVGGQLISMILGFVFLFRRSNLTTAVSVLGVYFKLQSFVFMPVFGLNSGAMPIMGYNFGARNKKRLLQALKCGVLYAFAIMTVGLVLFQIFPDVFLRMFDASDNMMEIGVRALRIISLCFPFAAIGIMLSTLFQAVGQGVNSMIMSLCRQIIVLIPVAYLLAMEWGLNAVWYAFVIAEAVSLFICIALLRRTHARYIKPLDDQPEAVK